MTEVVISDDRGKKAAAMEKRVKFSIRIIDCLNAHYGVTDVLEIPYMYDACYGRLVDNKYQVYMSWTSLLDLYMVTVYGGNEDLQKRICEIVTEIYTPRKIMFTFTDPRQSGVIKSRG